MYYTTQVPKLVSRLFTDEVILANFETGLYYSLTGTAADIWLGLHSGATVKEIVAAIVTLGDQGVVATTKSVESFIEKLLIDKLIAPHDGIPDRHPWSPQFSDPFSQPMLDRFDDLRDLLFLDPIHDVGEAGWPVRATDGG